jgi:hypothetical protein
MKNLLALIALISGSMSLFARPIIQCSDLMTILFGKDAKIESAVVVPATAAIPEHCDVRGTIWPEAKFAVNLPAVWNNRLFMAGNGGNAGRIPLPGMSEALSKGFATTGTDTGHDATKEPEAIFAWPGPHNPNAARKVIDFAYLAVHETVVLAKTDREGLLWRGPPILLLAGLFPGRTSGVDRGTAVSR